MGMGGFYRAERGVRFENMMAAGGGTTMAMTWRTIPWWRIEYAHQMLKALPGYRGMGVDRQRQAAYVLSHLLVGRTRGMTAVSIAVTFPVVMLLVIGGLGCCFGPLIVRSAGGVEMVLALICFVPGMVVVQLIGISAGLMAATWMGRWQHPELMRRAFEAASGVPSCLACGYDMRMLDRPTCPECGGPTFDVTRVFVPYAHMAAQRRKFAYELLRNTPTYLALPTHRQRAVATELSHRLAETPMFCVRQSLLIGTITLCITTAILALPVAVDWLAPQPDAAVEFPLLVAIVGIGIVAWLAIDRLLVLPRLRRWQRERIDQTLEESGVGRS